MSGTFSLSPPPLCLPSTNCSFYNVSAGDSCDAIADKFGTPVVNVTEGGAPCPSWTLQPGDTLLVCQAPSPPTPPGCQKHVVTGGETFQRIAGHFHTTVGKVTKQDSSPCPAQLVVGCTLFCCPTPLYPPTDCTFTDVVAGDTCEKIATDNNVTVNNVTEGGLPCPGGIDPGDTLLVCK